MGRYVRSRVAWAIFRRVGRAHADEVGKFLIKPVGLRIRIAAGVGECSEPEPVVR
jgi:hypothetical protein